MSHDLQSPSVASPPPSLLVQEESVWKRYSPHQEFPLSVAASVLLHLLAAGMVVLGGVLVFKFGTNDTSPTMELVVFAGGGGSGDGAGNPNNTVMNQPEAYIDSSADKFRLETQLLDLDAVKDGDFKAQELRRKTADAKEELTRGQDRSGRVGEAGGGGPGSGGGTGPGQGPGVGPGFGPGINKGTRHLRQSRWAIVLPREDPEAFLKKLIEIQAILLIPDSERVGVYQVCEDLARRPVRLKPTDQKGINAYNRLWYMSHQQIDTQYIATALYLKNQPRWIAIFIPHELEQELTRQEFNYHKLSEAELQNRKWVTEFNVARRGDTWDVSVRYQGPRK